jgi:hypothetical protein
VGVRQVRVGQARTRPEGVIPPPGRAGLRPELMPRRGRSNHPGTPSNWAPKPPQFGHNSGPVLGTFFCENRAPKRPQKREMRINEYNQSLITQMRRTEATCFDAKVPSVRTSFEANCTPKKRASIGPKPRDFSPNVTLGENLGTFGSGLRGIPAQNRGRKVSRFLPGLTLGLGPFYASKKVGARSATSIKFTLAFSSKVASKTGAVLEQLFVKIEHVFRARFMLNPARQTTLQTTPGIAFRRVSWRAGLSVLARFAGSRPNLLRPLFPGRGARTGIPQNQG